MAKIQARVCDNCERAIPRKISGVAQAIHNLVVEGGPIVVGLEACSGSCLRKLSVAVDKGDRDLMPWSLGSNETTGDGKEVAVNAS